MSGTKTIVGLGELLWDLLPAGERLGGAPANFSVMAGRLGNRGVIASRLGKDARGNEARRVLKAFPVDQTYLQTDLNEPTGTVGVEVIGGEPSYLIHAPAAWDFLWWTPLWRDLAAEADAVCFGTLAQREPLSRETVRKFVGATRPECVRVFDVNLRAPFFSARTIAQSLPLVTIFKLNDSEVPIVFELLVGNADGVVERSERSLLHAARVLLGRYPLRLVAITMGSEGSLLVTRETSHRHRGVSAQVVDTVGAGDAFTAGLVDAYLRNATLAEMNEAGNRWGSWVASQPGGMPPPDAAARAAASKKITNRL
jgi:fructokinase